MFDNTMTLTIDNVDITLTRINQQDNRSMYHGAVDNRKVSLTISHNIPSRGQDGESHLVRLDVDHHEDVSGAYLRTSSTWMVIRTTNGVQNDFSSRIETQGLVDFCTAAFTDRVVGRES